MDNKEMKKSIVDNVVVAVLLCNYSHVHVIMSLHKVGSVAQLVERRSLTSEFSLSCAQPAADG